MHVAQTIDVKEVLESKPIQLRTTLTRVLSLFTLLGFVALIYGIVYMSPELFWGSFYINFIYWTGLALGSLIISAIFQITRALWSPPLRRIAEASVFFLPWSFGAFLLTYLGKEYLFPWGSHPMPGRETWMEPNFVYFRFGLLLFLLFFLCWRFVRLSLRSDLGYIRENVSDANKKTWQGVIPKMITGGWKGSDKEVNSIQVKMSRMAPVLVILYIVIYTMFATEMVASTDTVWYANMYGGFSFIGNIFMGWASLAILCTYFSRTNPAFGKTVTNQQWWDLGKLMFGFTMLWGYLFFSHFLPQWYGNLPEETQWLILRTREFPWKAWSWVTFAMCFVIPFISLLSRDLKKTPTALSTVACIILLGVWSEKYVFIMPSYSPNLIPFGIYDIFIFLGFLGVYGLSVTGFLKRFPYVPLSHPVTRGITNW
ncbi:MAG: hypothetical protein KDD56_10865 [Bdellovibrionales bacterium]|nr:hypothetical protein [Bdellovibrionales bacterium]